jgi:hypothetical protein
LLLVVVCIYVHVYLIDWLRDNGRCRFLALCASHPFLPNLPSLRSLTPRFLVLLRCPCPLLPLPLPICTHS